jgi:hypothetical protein
MSEPIDPENVTTLQPADLSEVEVDETPDDERPQPIEADPADVAEQRREVPLPDDDPAEFDTGY